MLFLTILFLTISILHLFNVRPIAKALKNIGLEIIQLYEDNPNITEKDEAYLKVGGKALAFMLITIVMALIELIYYIKGLNVDTYKYPSIFMIVIVILLIVKLFTSKSNKRDFKNAEDRVRYKIELENNSKLSLFRVLKALVDIGYFSYMFYILVFLR